MATMSRSRVRPFRTAAVTAIIATVLLSTLPLTSAAQEKPWLDEDFSNGAGGVFDSGFGTPTPGPGHVGPGVVSTMPRGQHWGSSLHWNTQSHLGYEPEEMWLRYYVMFPEGFRVADGNRGKIPGFAGLYSGNCRGGRASTTSAPCWSARLMFSPLYPNDGVPSWPHDPDEVTRIGFYAYLLSSSGAGRAGDVIPWNADIATLRHGRWYCVEAHVKMNTPGRSDGVLEGFVDGQTAYSASNVTFRRSGESRLKVKSLWFDVYHGGDATSPKTNTIHFDSLAAGPERIGCNDNPNARGTFHDDDGNVFEGDIEKLAASGITKGCNPPTNDQFCPEDPVTRGQMAAFLNRALSDRLPDPQLGTVPSPPDFWGVRSSAFYADVLDAFSGAGAPLDTYVLTYGIDDTDGDKNWLATGENNNPNKWVPMQLANVAARGAVPYVQISVRDLPGLVDGRYDRQLGRMVAAFKNYLDADPSHRLIVDILPGSNRRQVSYGDDPGRFKSAFRKIAIQVRDTLGTGRVRVAYSNHYEISSDRYARHEHPAGAPDLYFPGADLVDLAGVRGSVSSGSTSPQSHFGPALDALAAAAGSDMPLFISQTAAPRNSDPVRYLQALADYAAQHPQLVGVTWDDVVTGGVDYRLTSPSIPGGVATATQQLRTGGVNWLFSSDVEAWARARRQNTPFGDAVSSVFADDIAWLAATGITKGCNPPANTRFCPEDPVTRGQMAAFLVRALDLPPASGGFTDTRNSVFAADIAALANAGVTRGCNPPRNDRFCPENFVTRGQMAAFLVRAGLTD